jgi:vitellogenic carboxypeptidase-like protein
LFAENGPYSLDENLNLVDRNTSWNKNYSMIFIDNPVGAGYSYTGTGKGYCQNETCVADNLYNLMLTFYNVFPEQLPNDLYITGESYAGHYIPAFGYKIAKSNQASPPIKIPLKGVAIGDGWVDPVNMVPAYPNMMYNLALADENQRTVFENYCKQIIGYINTAQWYDAFTIWDQMINGDVYPYPNYFHNITGSNDYDNFMNTNPPASYDYYADYVTQQSVRAAIHVGNATFNDGSTCEMNLLDDFMKTLAPELTYLLNSKYKVMIYSGQLDIIIGAALTESFLWVLNWDGAAQYRAADRAIWRITPNDSEVAGYVRVASNLLQVVVRGAGHIVPGDQPDRALNMITRFIENQPFA